jgi:hypothetical protein
VHFEGGLIFDLLQVVTGNGKLGGGNSIGIANANQLGQRLRNRGAAGIHMIVALRDRHVLRRHERAPCPKRARRNADVLQVRYIKGVRFISDRREISGVLAGLFVLVLGDFQTGDSQRSILRQREMNRFRQGEPTDFRGLSVGSCQGNQQQ